MALLSIFAKKVCIIGRKSYVGNFRSGSQLPNTIYHTKTYTMVALIA